jgi:hypothetical protein
MSAASWSCDMAIWSMRPTGTVWIRPLVTTSGRSPRVWSRRWSASRSPRARSRASTKPSVSCWPPSHLLSAIVATATGQSTLAYARVKLFEPLGIPTDGAFEPVLGDAVNDATIDAYENASVAWPVDPQGYHFGAAFLRRPSRDLAKFGYLYLNGGQWDGHQLIPADYVAAATSPRGRSPNLSMGYGWHWWVAIEEGHQTFSARGYGGQFVYVVPDLDLVTVITSNPETSGVDPKILISRTIVPAVTS